MGGEYTVRYSLRALGNTSQPADNAGSILSISLFPVVPKERLVVLKPGPVDVLAQCPKCKTVETVQVVGDMLTRCRKFSQRGEHIYHDCGSEDPCRLHRVSPESRSSSG